LKGFALPRTEAFTTKAASKYTFNTENVGINKVAINNDANAPVEYYNLQGVKVANPSNGVFIKVQGNKSTKVYIK
jgi:tetrahydromethanopterin S-methyltransferase subunit A